MKYFIVEGSFANDHPTGAVLEAGIKSHIEYIQTFFDSGMVLFSGPKIGSGGGFIIMRCSDAKEIRNFCDNDPLFRSGIQTYRVTEFVLHECQDPLEYWFE